MRRDKGCDEPETFRRAQFCSWTSAALLRLSRTFTKPITQGFPAGLRHTGLQGVQTVDKCE